jgi:putative heme iron utilization protein
MDAHAPNGGSGTGATPSDEPGSATPPRPTPPSPSDAARARTVVAAQRLATLATLRPEGHPFGSVVQYVDDAGAPVVFVSELAEHTKHLRADGRASVLVASPVAVDDDPMALPRVSLVGRFATFAPAPAQREQFFDRHPTARAYADFADFAFWRLDIEAVRFVGGYGRMSWVDPAVYADAEPDPLSADIEGIVNHMNDDHADACLAYVQALGGVPGATAARLLSVDRLGMDLLASTPDGLATTRVNYPEPAEDTTAVRIAVVSMLRAIRAEEPT